MRGFEMSNLIGPRSYLQDWVAASKEAGVTVLRVNPVGGDPVRAVEEFRAIVDDA